MASIGRGRGWLQHDKSPLPKPGKSTCPEDVNHADIVNLINQVNDENLMEKVDEIVKLVNDTMNEQNFKNIHEKLYKHALNDKEFGLKLWEVYSSSMFKNTHDSENRSLYSHLVKSFQVDYERRKDLREENVTQFHNAICLFSKFLSCRKYISARTVLLALLDYMEMLVDTASADDIKIFAELVIIHGQYYHSSFKEEMGNLMITVREKLIKDNLSVTSRGILLYVIDLESRNFNPLPKSLQEFYKSQLESNFKEGDNNVIIKSLTIVEDEHNSSKNNSNHQKQDRNLVKNQSLRAIRGSGDCRYKQTNNMKQEKYKK
ncbi:CBP80/20-dependent translation initiation factor isoform X2 [Osmia lignaria lignaria]|uniref:CBP80/20-dependent translation initiation factor isoform X2 n=1 Tax=Osmia lignaria lignaria TaxID=1437193 RepID=UPI00402B9F6A